VSFCAGRGPGSSQVASVGVIDLHTHSTVSDGSDDPGTVVELAVEAGCSALALTDHDSLAGLGPARARAAELGITLVPGCEVSCLPVGAGGMHVLVYFVEEDGGPFAEELGRLRTDRRRRNLALAERLAGLGLPVAYDRVVTMAGGEEGVGRPHFAAALLEAGAVASVDDAFDRYLSDGRPGHVPKARLTGSEVAALARASGGVAVLAHPFSLGLDGPGRARVVSQLAESGFAGIEALIVQMADDVRRCRELLGVSSA